MIKNKVNVYLEFSLRLDPTQWSVAKISGLVDRSSSPDHAEAHARLPRVTSFHWRSFSLIHIGLPDKLPFISLAKPSPDPKNKMSV